MGTPEAACPARSKAPKCTACQISAWLVEAVPTDLASRLSAQAACPARTKAPKCTACQITAWLVEAVPTYLASRLGGRCPLAERPDGAHPMLANRCVAQLFRYRYRHPTAALLV